ncbi:hypothetical protein ACOZ38_25130 [Sphaerisporangium viridialbum]|uniref:hypothetical protein n=1 Tax=Sphaerisporangium viridialbum TaxID=46189 RepID=UPI003C71EFE2
MTWTLIDLLDDVRHDEANDRWLLIYKVPTDIVSSGDYSYSYPKNLGINLAAVYGYDVTKPEDVDELFDHVTYQAYMWETLRQEGRTLELQHNPFEMNVDAARSLVGGVVSTLKRDRPIVHGAAKAKLMRASDGTLHDVLRRDLVARLDPDVVAAHRDMAKQSRVATQIRMWDMALRMDRTRGPQ